MSVARQVQCSVLGLIGFIVIMSFLGSSIQGDVTPVVLSGQPAPGTANGRMTGMVGVASVNASGDMAFMTNLDVGGVASAGIFAIYGGVISPVVLEGQSLPDSSGRFFGGGLGQPQINNNGDIIFVSNFASNSSGAGFGWGVFLFSSGTLRKVADAATVAPGTSGQITGFGGAQINDNRDIAFVAGGPPYSSTATLFLMSSGNLTSIVSQPNFGGIAMNNRGDIVFRNTQSGISEYSGGTIKLIVGPGNGFSTGDQADELSVNDDGDIVFVDFALTLAGRGGSLLPVPSAVRRWRQGVVDKIAASGDPVPGIPGATFWTDFENPEINQSGVVFRSPTAPVGGQNPIGIICRFQNGELSVIAREDQPISGIGTLNRLGTPSFDDRQGSLMTFLANPGVLGTTTGPEGIYAAMAGQFPLLFPQIADGTAAGGGWRTKFILANQSTTASLGPATATISFYDDNGAPINLLVGGQKQSQITVTVPALGVAQIQTDGIGPLQTGWARVQSDQSLSGIALFTFFDGSGNFAGEVGDSASVPLRSMSLFAQSGNSTSTGIALANPNTSASSVTLTLRDSNASPIATSTLTIPPMGHLAKYAAEIFSSLPPGEFEGKVDVVSTLPLATITLRQHGSVFTTLPVIP